MAAKTFRALTALPAGASALDFVRSSKRQCTDGGDGDGRRRQANELRGLQISIGAGAQAAGSASIEVGRAKLLCTVHGPRPDAQAAHFSESGRLLCQVKFAAFSGVSEDEIERLSRELPLVIHPALEAAVQLTRFPKSLVEVHVLVLEFDGDICGPAITGPSEYPFSVFNRCLADLAACPVRACIDSPAFVARIQPGRIPRAPSLHVLGPNSCMRVAPRQVLRSRWLMPGLKCSTS